MKRKVKIKQQAQVVENPREKSSKFSEIRKWKFFLFLIGFLLYANTTTFEYALDDKIVITANQLTTQGFDGAFDHFFYDSMDGFWATQYGVDVADLNKDALVAGGRYRPLSLFTYALEWELFGEKPGISHFINALLYGLTGWVLFMVLLKLFPLRDKRIYKSIAFWATLIFLVHPLHVEVVANIKSRDEILSVLFGLWAIYFTLKYAENKNFKQLVYASLLLFVSLMSKETTIAFVALGPLTLYFFDKGDKMVWRNSFFALLVGGFAYTFIRFMVIGSSESGIVDEVMNNPFLNATEGQKLATIFLILTAYVKLLFIPAPLTHDYYPYHLPFLPAEEHYATWSNISAILGVILILVMLWVSVRSFKSKNVYGYVALFFLGTSILISNLFFPIGVFMNERFMYAPSIAFAILLVYVLLEEFPARFKGFKVQSSYYILGGIALFFAILSFNRTHAWQNDKSLALADVEVSLGSAKVKMAAADALLQELPEIKNQEERQEIINLCYAYLSESLEIYPEYFPPLDLLGRMYFEAGNYNESIRFYELCIQRKPNNTQFVENIFIIGNKHLAIGNYQEAFNAYQKAIEYQPNSKKYLLAIAQVAAKDLNNPSMGLPYMERVYTIYPNDIEVGEKMAITYAMLGRFSKAIEILTPIYEANPTNASVVKNLGISYYQMGDIQRGSELMSLANQLELEKN